jgi:hypothetical protein
VGFGPDLDPATPGVIVDCDNLIPSTQGMTAALSPVDAGLSALDSACKGAFVGDLLDGTRRIIAGTQAKLYDISGSAWVDRSKSGGYTGLAPWRFTMFGNNVLATNRAERIQQASPSGAFADIATAPAAGIICSAAGFVMAFNVSDLDGSFGDQPDGWWCSALYNQASWTPSATTQAANGRIVTAPGPFTAGRELGDAVVAYKAKSMHLGQYVGPPVIWAWSRVPGDIGCASHEAVVVVGSQHFFIGPNDFYTFDGTTPRSIGSPIREWFFSTLDNNYRANIKGAADLARDLVYWYFPSHANGGVCDQCVVYNIRTNKWGRFARQVEAVVQYSSGNVTYDGIGSLYSTYDGLPNISYDAPFWIIDNTVAGMIGTDHKIYSLTGVPGNSYMVTGDMGDETGFSLFKRITPRYRLSPPTGQATNYYRYDLGTDPIQDTTSPQFANRFDFLRSARWHRVRFDWSGSVTLNAITPEIIGTTPE